MPAAVSLLHIHFGENADNNWVALIMLQNWVYLIN